MRIVNVERLLMLAEATPSPLKGRGLHNVVLIGNQGYTADFLEFICCTGAGLLRFVSIPQVVVLPGRGSVRSQTLACNSAHFLCETLRLVAIDVLVKGLFTLILICRYL